MKLDIVDNALLKNCNTGYIYDAAEIIGTSISGSSCLRLEFDHNTNLDYIRVNLKGSPFSYAEYGTTLYPTKPAFTFPYTCGVDTTPTYKQPSWYDLTTVASVSGTVCSGVRFEGATYIKSDPIFILTESYTFIFKIHPVLDTQGAVPNLFFYIQSPTEDLYLHIQDSELYVTIGTDTINTGLKLYYSTDNIISIRTDINSKLRLGCNNQYIELDRDSNFLGSNCILYLGGFPGLGNFNGEVRDALCFIGYVPNEVVDIYTKNVAKLVGLAQNTVSPVASGTYYTYNINNPYTSYVDLFFDGPSYSFNQFEAVTYDSVVVYSSGIDNLYCGTIVKGLDDVVFDVDVVNTTGNDLYGYLFAYDYTTYKGLKVSLDNNVFEANQIWLPTTISWSVGDFFTGPNSRLSCVESSDVDLATNGILIYDVNRKAIIKLDYNEFKLITLRNNRELVLSLPSFITGSIDRTNTCACLSEDSLYLYVIHTDGIHRYDFTRDEWVHLKAISGITNVDIYANNAVVFSYYLNGVYIVELYDGSFNTLLTIDTLPKVAIDEEYAYCYVGNLVYKYNLTTKLNEEVLPKTPVYSSDVLEFASAGGFVILITDTTVYGSILVGSTWSNWDYITSFSSVSSFCSSSRGSIAIAAIKDSSTVALKSVSYITASNTTVNTYVTYNNDVSLKLISDTSRFKAWYGWFDKDSNAPNFEVLSKVSITSSRVFGFAVNTSSIPVSIFYSYNFLTDEYLPLAQINNGLIDARGGVLLDDYDTVYLINFKQSLYYKYVKNTDSWIQLTPILFGPAITDYNIMDAVIADNKIYFICIESGDGSTSSETYKTNSFAGYYDIQLDVFVVDASVPFIPATGSQGTTVLNGQRITTDVSALIDYDASTKRLFMAASHYLSRAKYFIIDTTITLDNTSYLYSTLSDMYADGAYVYLPFTGYRGRNVLLSSTGISSEPQGGDIPDRQAVETFVYYESIGATTNYNFTILCRVIVSNTTDRFILADRTVTASRRYGFEIGVYDSKLYMALNAGSYYYADVAFTDINFSTDTWYDLGCTYSTTNGEAKLYIDGNLVLTLNFTAGDNYIAEQFLRDSCKYSVRSSSIYTYYPTGQVNELVVYRRVLSDTELSEYRYGYNNKKFCRLWYDSKIIYEGYTPQQTLIDDTNTYYYSIKGKRILGYSDTGHFYLLSERSIQKFRYIDYSWDGYLVYSTYEYGSDLGVPSLVSSFVHPSTGELGAFVDTSAYPNDRLVFIEGDSIVNGNKYFKEGAYISPIIDTNDDTLFTYAVDVSATKDSDVSVYLRSANTPPIDYVHLYAISNGEFIEKSLTTGKIFYKLAAVSQPNSCATYYTDSTYFVTIDGKVYKNGDYINAVYEFSINNYTLANIIKTYFSPFGNFILYVLSGKQLAGFPLGLGFPCSVVSVDFETVYDVSWNKAKQEIALSTDIGVVVFNYKLGIVAKYPKYRYLFWLSVGTVFITEDGDGLLIKQDGTSMTFKITDLLHGSKIKHNVLTDKLYYLSTADNSLAVLDVGTSVTSTKIYSNVVDIVDVNYRYIFCTDSSSFLFLTTNGVLAGKYDFSIYDSYGFVFHKYSSTTKIDYYGTEYIFNNDLVWFGYLPWTKLGHKTKGVVSGDRYVQFKVVLRSDSLQTVSPTLKSIYIGKPVVVRLKPFDSVKCYIKLNTPSTDNMDLFSTKIVSYFETLVL